MIGLVLRRFAMMLVVMGVVAVIAFFLLRLTPGDPAAIMAGELASAEEVAQIRTSLGLDRPLPFQLLTWLGALARGDLGASIFSSMTVSQLIAQRIEPTVSLAVATLVVTILVGVPLGVLAAWKNGSALDRLVSAMSVVGFAVPSFVLAYVLILLVSVQAGLLPAQGFVPISQGLGAFARSIALPTLSLSLVFIALVVRMTRAAVLEVLGEDYVRTAYAKGASQTRVLFKHALRSAAVPIVTVIGIGVGLLIGGVVVIESVYNIPGVGRLVVDAILKRDYPVIQGAMIVLAAAHVIVNFAVDLAYLALDPRVRY